MEDQSYLHGLWCSKSQMETFEVVLDLAALAALYVPNTLEAGGHGNQCEGSGSESDERPPDDLNGEVESGAICHYLIEHSVLEINKTSLL